MYAVVLHAHQKLDKVARNCLAELLGGDTEFPTYRDIVRFEGQNGPDSTRLKQGAGSEQPWHFYDPLDPQDTELPRIIEDHYRNLVAALSAQNRARAAFEAAWLAHALVDGLTPAHHYPYEEELKRLRGGQPRQNRVGLRNRALVRAGTPGESIKRSVQLIGPNGLLMNHTTFEGGAYTIIQMMRFRRDAFPSEEAFKHIEQTGIAAYFTERARVVAELHQYEQFMASGWTPQLGRQVRRRLIPEMVQMISLAWYQAAKEAGLPVGTVVS